MFFNYDLFLNLEGNPPVNHLRCEKLTFNNPTKEFRRKLIKAGGVRLPFALWPDQKKDREFGWLLPSLSCPAQSASFQEVVKVFVEVFSPLKRVPHEIKDTHPKNG